MTTAFQTVIDNAESISIFKRKKVAQTVARDGTVRSLSLGGQVWEFSVQLPNGPRWTEYRPLIERMEALDRVTVGQIQIYKEGHSWINQYQGSILNPNSVSMTVTTGNTLTFASTITGVSPGQYRFRAGDLIQLGSTGAVYSVIEDVPHNGTTVSLNRPIREAAGTYTIRVGQSVVWNVICTTFPNWTLIAKDQIGWSGPFVFSEAL
jgi:uncharacterized membrane protein